MVERQALDQQQGRAQVAEPGQQPEQRRLVGPRAGAVRLTDVAARQMQKALAELPTSRPALAAGR